MTVADYCETSIAIVNPEASLRTAAEQMRKEEAGLLLVADARQTFGVITDRDLVVALADTSRDADSARVADAMSQPAVVIRSDAPIAAALSLMHRKGVRRLPVLDAHSATGLLASDDLVRLLGDEFQEIARAVAAQRAQTEPDGARPRGAPQPSRSRTAAQRLHEAVWSSASATLAQVAARMKGPRDGCVIVVGNAGEAVGIITARDLILRAVTAGRSFGATLAASVMSSPLVTADPEHTQREILAKMTLSGIRRIPILKDGRLIGIVSLDDLLVNISQELGAMAPSSPHGQLLERARTRVARLHSELNQKGAPLKRAMGQAASLGLRTAGRRLVTLGEWLRRSQ